MAFVREQVKIDFPQQHAHMDGPNTRQLFPLKTSVSTSLVLQIEEDEVILKAGLVSGVHVGNVYGLMPHGSEQLIKSKQLGRATVTEVVGFNSLTELELFSEIGDHIPKSGVLAFLEHEAFPKWPVAVPQNHEKLRCSVKKSKYIRTQSKDEDDISLVRFKQTSNFLTLSTNHGIAILTENTFDKAFTILVCDNLVQAAETLAPAQHLLAFIPYGNERLDHSVTVTIGKVDQGRPGELIETGGSDSVADTNRIFILLQQRW